MANKVTGKYYVIFDKKRKLFYDYHNCWADNMEYCYCFKDIEEAHKKYLDLIIVFDVCILEVKLTEVEYEK